MHHHIGINMVCGALDRFLLSCLMNVLIDNINTKRLLMQKKVFFNLYTTQPLGIEVLKLRPAYIISFVRDLIK